MKIVDRICELIRETSSSLPEDVLKAVKSAARKEEKGSSAAVVLKTILDNCALAKKKRNAALSGHGNARIFH